MRLRRLRLQNFRQHADTTVEFDVGLTGIVGPNGSGKTTLLEAIAWAMYGTPAARGTRDSIRRRAAPPRSRVEVDLEFELGPHVYRVVRSLQTAALYLDGDPAPIANSSGAVTERVNRLLGMTREEFFNTYFTGQKELATMSSMTGPERARFLSRVLGYERLAAAQVKLKESRTALRASLQATESGLPDLEALQREETAADERLAAARAGQDDAVRHLAAARQALADAVPEWEAAQKRREQVQSIETDLKVAEHRAEEARRVFQQLDKDLAESLGAKARRDELQPKLVDYEALVEERETLDRDAQAYAGRRALDTQSAEIDAQLAALAERLGRLATPQQVEAARKTLAAAHEAEAKAAGLVEERHGAWIREKQDAETKRTSLLQQHEDVEEQLRRLQESGPTTVCPTCGKPLGKEYSAVLEDLEARRDEIMLQGKFYRQRIDQLTPEPADLLAARRALEVAEAELERQTAAVARLEVEVADRAKREVDQAALVERLAAVAAQLAASPTRYDEARHKVVKARLAELEPLRELGHRLAAAADRAPDLVTRAAEAEQNLSKAEAAVTELRERLLELGWSAEAFDAVRTRYRGAEQERQVAEVRAVRADAELAAATEHRRSVAERRAERDRRAAAAEQVRVDLLLNQELDRAFTDLRDELNATIRPELSDAASVLIRDLTAGRYADLELNDDYVPVVVDEGEPKTVISGGEEDIANLALRLAISQMIAERAGQPFALLVLDEIFGSLDEDRRSAVVDLLRGLADRFPQVVLITHIESVRDGFDRIVRIEYDAERGAATAREEVPRLAVPHVAA